MKLNFYKKNALMVSILIHDKEECIYIKISFKKLYAKFKTLDFDNIFEILCKNHIDIVSICHCDENYYPLGKIKEFRNIQDFIDQLKELKII